MFEFIKANLNGVFKVEVQHKSLIKDFKESLKVFKAGAKGKVLLVTAI